VNKFILQHFKFLIFSLLLSLSTYSMHASAEDCMQIINRMLTQLDANVATTVDLDKHFNHRNFITKFAKKNGVPVFIKQNYNGVDVPVILVNKKTAPKLKDLFENSFGTQAALQKDWNNDHGLLRAGKFIIDLDAPGARGFGEVEYTGLAWKNIESYLPRKSPGSSPVVEVTYLLTPNEHSVIDYYQKVRRSALFRVKFTFGGAVPVEYPNLLKSGGEHCFIFCKATAVRSHVQEIRTKLVAMGLADPDKFIKDPEVQISIGKIQQMINNSSPDNLHSNLLNHPSNFSLFTNFFPVSVTTNEEKLVFMNWVISLDSSTKYAQVLSDLGVTGDYGLQDAINKRASAIFIYDEGADPATFNNATYSNYGKMISWPKTLQFPAE
jgi:hypothetical protein